MDTEKKSLPVKIEFRAWGVGVIAQTKELNRDGWPTAIRFRGDVYTWGYREEREDAQYGVYFKADAPDFTNEVDEVASGTKV